MSRETKVGLLVGLCVILLVGILVSDHLAVAPGQAGPALEAFGPESQARLITPSGETPLPADDPRAEVRMGEAPDHRSGRQSEPDLAQPESGEQFRDPWDGQVRPHDQRRRQEEAVALRERLTGVWVNPGRLPDDLPDLPAAKQTNPRPTISIGPTPRLTHRVGPDDTLIAIARRYLGDAGAWRRIRDANPGKVGEQGEIRIGVELLIPEAPQQADARLPQAEIPNPGPAQPVERWIDVKPGQTLSELAATYLGSSRNWRDLLEANRDQLNSDRDLRAGMKLRLPRRPDTAVTVSSGNSVSGPRPTAPPTRRQPEAYVVQPGDTLVAIARRTLGDGEMWRRIMEANADVIDRPEALPVGARLRIPSF